MLFDLQPSANILKAILAENGLSHPDGRALYRYKLGASVSKEKLFEYLRTRKPALARPQNKELCGLFVLLASIWYREDTTSGYVRFNDFLKHLEASSWPGSLRSGIIERGLAYWNLEVRQRSDGHNTYVHSLWAQGGIPRRDHKNLQQALKELISKIETSLVPNLQYGQGWALDCFEQYRISDFLKEDYSFRDDFFRLAQKIISLRDSVPEGYQGEKVISYLNRANPGWSDDLSIPLAPEQALSFIKPVMEEKRPRKYSPLAKRELRFDPETETWKSRVAFVREGYLPAVTFLGNVARQSRLSVEAQPEDRKFLLDMEAVPNEDGWDTEIDGVRTVFPISPFGSLTLTAWIDGEEVGKTEYMPALTEDTPIFWTPDNENENTLVLADQRGRTQHKYIYLLTLPPKDLTVSEGVKKEGEFALGEMTLFKFSGNGEATLDNRKIEIRTNDQSAALNTTLQFVNDAGSAKLLPYWKTDRGMSVWVGEPIVLAHAVNSRHSYPQVDWREGKALFRRIADVYYESGEHKGKLGSLSGLFFPGGTSIKLREVPAGLECEISGFTDDFIATLSAPDCPELNFSLSEDQAVRATLICSTTTLPPATCSLTITNQYSGSSLTLRRPWPAASPYFSKIDQQRVPSRSRIYINQTNDLYAHGPDNERVFLNVKSKKYSKQHGIYPLRSPAPLSSYQAFFERLLAQSDYDAQLILTLVSQQKSFESSVFLSRYCSARDFTGEEELTVHAVKVKSSDNEPQTETFQCAYSDWERKDLGLHLLDKGGWLCFAFSDGKPLRALYYDGSVPPRSTFTPRACTRVVPAPPANSAEIGSSREDRIIRFGEEWRRNLKRFDPIFWRRKISLFKLIQKHEGDLSALDEGQALGTVPEAAIVMLLLCSDAAERRNFVDIDRHVPIFWNVLSVRSFKDALEYVWNLWEVQRRRVEERFEVLERILTELLGILPSLSAHFGLALGKCDFFDMRHISRWTSELKNKLNPKKDNVENIDESKLYNRAQAQARNLADGKGFSRVPYVDLFAVPLSSGWNEIFVRGGRPVQLPGGEDTNIRNFLEAPFLCAKLVLTDGLRKMSPQDAQALKRAFIYLKQRDPTYFSETLPTILMTYAGHSAFKSALDF